jgi:hypothetical protein
MRRSILLLCLIAWPLVLTAQNNTSAPAAAPALQLTLDFTDGSRIVGAPAIDRLKIKSQFADMEVQLSRIHSVEFSDADHATRINLKNGDRITCNLYATGITINTLLGPVVIPFAKLKEIRAGAPGESMPDGLVLRYTFDKDEGATVTDASGHGLNGKLHGATYTRQGKSGGAMSFNGDRQSVIVGNPPALQLQNFTFMAWIKRGATDAVCKTSEWGCLFGYCVGGYDFGIHNNNHLFLGKSGTWPQFSSFEIRDQAFHHVAVTKQGSKVVFYLDGKAYPGADSGDTYEFNSIASVGGRTDTYLCTFLGLMDELAVFNRALSAEEVKDVYDSQK